MNPYQPEPLPIEALDLGHLVGPVGRSNAALARYAGLMDSLGNPTVLLSPLTTNEAVLSSRIEGTQATIEEVLAHDAGGDEPPKTIDIQEVLNYRTALRRASAAVIDRPITLSLILSLHKILMTSVRGEEKAPGEFRRDQNWIGPYNTPIERATFVPPAPLQLHDHLLRFEAYLKSDDQDPLVQTAVAHAQFELLHPFKDGNGRIGRLLISLLLFSKGCLAKPLFYLSEFLEEHRDEYYARLQAISQQRDWTGWVGFFLDAIEQQAKVNGIRVRHILRLRDEVGDWIRKTTRSQYSEPLADLLFDRPVFRRIDLTQLAHIPTATAQTLVRQLLDASDSKINVLTPGAGRRAETYWFPELIRLAEAKNLPAI